MTKGHSVGIVESCQVDSRPPAILKRFRANSTTAAASQNKIKKKKQRFFSCLKRRRRVLFSGDPTSWGFSTQKKILFPSATFSFSVGGFDFFVQQFLLFTSSHSNCVWRHFLQIHFCTRWILAREFLENVAADSDTPIR